MRLVLSSLILAAGLSSAAQAQDPAPTAPAETAAAPAVTAPTAPAVAPEPPPLPTAGPGFEAIQVLERICKPVVRGEKLDDVAKAQGFRLNRREQNWTRPLGTGNRAYQIIVYPPGSNRGVCMADLRFAMGQEEEIAKALNVWAFVHSPPLDPTANYTQPQDPDGLKRVRRSWEYLTANSSIGLNFSTVRNPDDTQVNKNYDMATMQYQERTF